MQEIPGIVVMATKRPRIFTEARKGREGSIVFSAFCASFVTGRLKMDCLVIDSPNCFKGNP
jgi:hypothetical protein